MELVEGETLRARRRRGPFGVGSHRRPADAESSGSIWMLDNVDR
jgi:hypothetical protein